MYQTIDFHMEMLTMMIVWKKIADDHTRMVLPLK